MDVDIVETFLMDQLISEKEEKEKDSSEVWKELGDVKKLMKNKEKNTKAALRDARRENLYYLLNLKADWLELKKQTHCLNNLIPPDHDLLRSLNQIKKKLQEPPPTADHQEAEAEAAAHHQYYSWFPTKQDIYRWSSEAVDPEKIHGFEEKGMIMERLLVTKKEADRSLILIEIMGVAGVGKTALCQLTFNSQRVQNHFPIRIWLCFSNNKIRIDAAAEGLTLEKRILSCLGVEDEVIHELALDERRLQLALRHQLNRGRYLIVLDDVWAVEEDICSLMTTPGERGGAIIVNSRDDKFLKKKEDEEKKKKEDEEKKKKKKEDEEKMDKILEKKEDEEKMDKILEKKEDEEKMDKILDKINKQSLLALVDEEICWKIFSDAVKKDGLIKEVPAEMERRKKEIVEKCEGLPLMAKMLGEIGHHIVLAREQTSTTTTTTATIADQQIQTHP